MRWRVGLQFLAIVIAMILRLLPAPLSPHAVSTTASVACSRAALDPDQEFGCLQHRDASRQTCLQYLRPAESARLVARYLLRSVVSSDSCSHELRGWTSRPTGEKDVDISAADDGDVADLRPRQRSLLFCASAWTLDRCRRIARLFAGGTGLTATLARYPGRGLAAGRASCTMVVLNKIYTRTGDAGMTALGTGERVPKHCLRIAAYGTVDETNAAIGIARLHLRDATCRRRRHAGAHPERSLRSRRRPDHARARQPSAHASGCA